MMEGLEYIFYVYRNNIEKKKKNDSSKKKKRFLLHFYNVYSIDYVRQMNIS